MTLLKACLHGYDFPLDVSFQFQISQFENIIYTEWKKMLNHENYL